MELAEIVILAVIFVAVISHYSESLHLDQMASIPEQTSITVNKVATFFSNRLGKIILYTLLVVVIFFVLKIVYSIVASIILRKKYLKQELHIKESKLKALLKEPLETLTSERVKSRLKELAEFDISKKLHEKYDDLLKEKFSNGKEEYLQKSREEELKSYQNKKNNLLKELEEVKEEISKEKREHWKNKAEIIESLKLKSTRIFEKDKLREEELEALSEEKDFEETNEYDPKTKTNKSFFVKKILNHSARHTFLVARIKEMLEEEQNVEDVIIHDTVDADLTFEIKNKTYAIEVETGTLLAKKKQLEEKVLYLKEKYQENWFFVVTHRDLVKKYKKFFSVTPRSKVAGLIQKLARN